MYYLPMTREQYDKMVAMSESLDCPAKVTVYLKRELKYSHDYVVLSPIEEEEVHIQCDRLKDHEGDHETWIPSYGYVRFPKKALG